MSGNEAETGRRLTTDVEITPEMIEAGIEVFCAHDDRFDEEKETVRRIYSAMERLRQSSGR